MSGYKHRNTVVMEETEKGIYPPDQSEINFAVPSKDILTAFSPYGLEVCSEAGIGRRPGILRDMIETLTESPSKNSYCLTFDGKKLKRGLTKSCGDIDLLGFETGLSLAEMKKQVEDMKKPIELMMQTYSDRDYSLNLSSDINENERKEIAETLTVNLRNVSRNILNARELRKKKEFAKEKLIERSGGSDWKNGKYVLAISSTIAFIHDIDEFLKESLLLVDELNVCISCLKQSNKMITQDIINLDKSDNYKKIKLSEKPTTRQVKQRSPEWFEQRSKARITGSTMYAALGLDGLAKQKEHFDVTILGLCEKTKPENVKRAMAHGTENEIHAAATMVGKVLPMLCPGQRMYEEGFIEIGSKNNTSFMVVSPDGSVRSGDGEESTTMAIELKCPIFDIQRSFPQRYLLQCMSEMAALDVETLLYLCWRPDISTVFKVHRNTPIFNKAFTLAESMYGIENPKRPTKLSQETKLLQEEIHEMCETSTTVEFIGVFPSLKNSNTAENTYGNGKFLMLRFDLLLRQLLSSYEKFHELQRMPATEAVVFLCCDLDRTWGKDTVHSVPVCWFPKGNSLDTLTMRKILESVLDTCKQAGLHIPAVSFDGQWHNIAVRDANGKPLTLLQLQKDLWKQVEQTPKRDILQKIAEMNKVVKRHVQTSVDDEGSVKRSIICTNGGIILPNISSSVVSQRLKGRKQSINETHVEEIEMSEKEFMRQLEEVVAGEVDSSINSAERAIDAVNGDDTDSRVNDDGQEAVVNERQTEQTISLNENDMVSLLKQFKVDKHSNAKQNWNDKIFHDISAYFKSGQSLRKLRDAELRLVVRYINRNHRMKMKESDRKEAKVQQICKLLNLEYSMERQKSSQQKTKQPKRLSELAFKLVSNTLKKSDINIIYAEYLWPEEHRKWNTEHSRSVVNKQQGIQFYFPSRSDSRKQLEVSCIDSSHLLTRMRRKSAKGGLDGVSNEAWRKVAKSKKTGLSLGMVDCILEPMTVAVANTHFSEGVEKEMRANGDVKEANLCKVIRDWWRAEDEVGIAADQRLQLHSSLRSHLMSRVNLSEFPPPGMYINGWPTQLWEAIIASIDAKAILYSLTPDHTYNVRAFSSMMGETFFSELTLYDRRGQGTVTSTEFGRYIDTSIEKLHMRLDPKRPFSYTTSKKKVYKLVDQYSTKQAPDTDERDMETQRNTSGIVRDHEFDNPGRLRVKPKAKEAKVESGRNAIARGALGVRWESARRNESKLLPTYRLGLDLEEI